MSDRSWMYQDSSEGLYRQDYLQGVECFINFILFKPKNINIGEITCSYVKCKNKKFHRKNIVMMYPLKKEFVKKYMCWYTHREPYVFHGTMLKRAIDSTSNYNNIHGFANDNNNPYKNMMINTIGMSQGY